MSRFTRGWTLLLVIYTCTVTQYHLPHERVVFHQHYASEEGGMSPSRRKNKTCERVNELRVSQPPACYWCCRARRVQFNRLNLLYLQLSHLSCFWTQITQDKRLRLRHSATVLHFHPIHVQVKTSLSLSCAVLGHC